MVEPMQMAALKTNTRQSICPERSMMVPAMGGGKASTRALIGSRLEIGIAGINTGRNITKMIIIVLGINKQRILGNIAVNAGSVFSHKIISTGIIRHIVESHLGDIVRWVHIDAAAAGGITNNVIRYEALPGGVGSGIKISCALGGISDYRVIDELRAGKQYHPAADRRRVAVNQIAGDPGVAEIRHYPASRIAGIGRDQVASNDGSGLNAADSTAISHVTHVSVWRHVSRDDVSGNGRGGEVAVNARAPKDVSAEIGPYVAVTAGNGEAGKD